MAEYVWWTLDVMGELACNWYNSPIKQQFCYGCEDQGYKWIETQWQPWLKICRVWLVLNFLIICFLNSTLLNKINWSFRLHPMSWRNAEYCWLRFVMKFFQGFSNVLNALVFLEMTQNQDDQLSMNYSTEQPQQEDNGHTFVFSLKVHMCFSIWYFVFYSHCFL